MFHFTYLLAVLLFPVTCVAQAGYPPVLPGSQAVVYKKAGETELRMWVYTPPAEASEKAKPQPAVVFFFGGGWKKGTPAQFESHCRYLASRGVVAATADYRVAERNNVKAVACVEDAKSAVRWLRENANRFNIDPNRICAAGGSAGGHIACCTALVEGFDAMEEDHRVSSVPNAMALFNPAVMLAELDGFSDHKIEPTKFADIATRTGAFPKQISPIHHVREGLPPAIIFHGEADTAVPFATVEEFSARMRAKGNHCELKSYPDAPHGFFNDPGDRPTDVRGDQKRQWHLRTLLQLDNFLTSLNWIDGDSPLRVVDEDFVSLRGDLSDSFYRFAVEKRGHVAFLGGSITEMNGYRPRVCEWLQKTFPETEFQFTNAGISSTCSTTGAFRLHRDVLAQGPVDLLFVEFAVNDDQDAAHTADNCVRGMEGLIRHTLQHNPRADIVMTHFVNPGMLETLNAGDSILSAGQHERVARHYGVSSVYLSKIVAGRIRKGQLTWKQFGGTHPGPEGNQLAADMATAVLKAGWKGLTPQNAAMTERVDLPKPLLRNSYTGGRLLPFAEMIVDDGWEISEPNWQKIEGGKRSRFLGIPLLHSETPGAVMEVKFEGTGVGAWVLAGPDAGSVECSIDDGEWVVVDLYHRFSKGLHYPRTVMFANELTAGPHTLRLRVAPAGNDDRGTAVRIHHVVVNEPGAE